MAPVENMQLNELVDLLHVLEGRRTPVGWSIEDANAKVSVERQIMKLVGQSPLDGNERRDSMRVTCEFTVFLRSMSQAAKGIVLDVGAGGVFVATESCFPMGEKVEVEVRQHGTEEHGLRLWGNVAWQKNVDIKGIGLSFTNQPSEIHSRRLRRFILELLRYCEAENDQS